ncbi:recombinase family protein [Streptomyces formicae]|uniref:Recombinase family protein n=1 Tax=Streptomyces formicae TaxID=1616117 RepID=A0ABY3WQK0_9ACTN|nr:recombinase family protein [Streptomyces formicae]UNM14923.1 recombinase family protein [Streptomyces formicae]
MPDLAEPAADVEQFVCPTCEVSAGSTRWTRGWQGRPEVPHPTLPTFSQLRAELGVTAQQELQSRLDALHGAGYNPVFSEKTSARITVRPEFVKAMDFARTIKKAVPHQRVIFTVHEMKCLGGGAAELLTIAEDLRHHDIQPELLTSPLQEVC